MTTDIQLIQYPYQLSEAACIPRKFNTEFQLYLMTCFYWGVFNPEIEEQDYGLETFSTDTLEGGLPDD